MGRKVLSFCIFTANNSDNYFVLQKMASQKQKQLLYWIGLYKNLRLAKTLFPDWEVRVYFNASVANNTHLLRTRVAYPQARFISMHGVWDQGKALCLARMLPMLESDVDWLFCLDLDNLITPALHDEFTNWQASAKMLFLPADHNDRIPGGCFGLGPTRDRKHLINKMQLLLETEHDFAYGCDEDFILNAMPKNYLTKAYISHKVAELIPDATGKISTEQKHLPKRMKMST